MTGKKECMFCEIKRHQKSCSVRFLRGSFDYFMGHFSKPDRSMLVLLSCGRQQCPQLVLYLRTSKVHKISLFKEHSSFPSGNPRSETPHALGIPVQRTPHAFGIPVQRTPHAFGIPVQRTPHAFGILKSHPSVGMDIFWNRPITFTFTFYYINKNQP